MKTNPDNTEAIKTESLEDTLEAVARDPAGISELSLKFSQGEGDILRKVEEGTEDMGKLRDLYNQAHKRFSEIAQAEQLSDRSRREARKTAAFWKAKSELHEASENYHMFYERVVVDTRLEDAKSLLQKGYQGEAKDIYRAVAADFESRGQTEEAAGIFLEIAYTLFVQRNYGWSKRHFEEAADVYARANRRQDARNILMQGYEKLREVAPNDAQRLRETADTM